jgi:hypothetical protein
MTRITPTQRALLSPVVSSLIRHQTHAWSELKREVADSDYANVYEWELEFMQPAERALQLLIAGDKDALVVEWNRVNKDGISRTEELVIQLHAVLVIKEIVKRAKAAVRRE